MQERSTRTPWRRAMLGLSGGPTDSAVIHLGSQLAKLNNAELYAVHVVEVDWTHDLSEDVASGNEQASSVLDLAEVIAEQYKVKLITSLLQARDVAAALVDEAVESGVDALIIGLPYRKRFGGDFTLGVVVPYVLENAPCEVVLAREPVSMSDERRSRGIEQAQVALPSTAAVARR